MAKAAPLITSTNAGELGPYLEGRTDLAKYMQGAKLSQGFVHKVQGPAVRCAGTRFIEAVKNSANRTWLVEFEFSAKDQAAPTLVEAREQGLLPTMEQCAARYAELRGR